MALATIGAMALTSRCIAKINRASGRGLCYSPPATCSPVSLVAAIPAYALCLHSICLPSRLASGAPPDDRLITFTFVLEFHV